MPGFLDLPVEMRVQIYKNLPSWRRPPSKVYPFNKATETATFGSQAAYGFHPAILRVNKTIHAESKPVFYSRNTWIFSLTSNARWPSYLLPLEIFTWTHVRKVIIYYAIVGMAKNLYAYTQALLPHIEALYRALSYASALQSIEIAWYDQRMLFPRNVYHGGVSFTTKVDNILERIRDEWRPLLRPLAFLPMEVSFKIKKDNFWYHQLKMSLWIRDAAFRNFVQDVENSRRPKETLGDSAHPYSPLETLPLPNLLAGQNCLCTRGGRCSGASQLEERKCICLGKLADC